MTGLQHLSVVGLDLSLTATGVALPSGDTCCLRAQTGIPERVRKRGDHRTQADDMARLDWLDQHIRKVVDNYDPDLVVIEGYSRGSKSGREEAGELGGCARLACWRTTTTWVAVAPKSLKAFACNNGTADKPKMALRARDDGWTGDDHNEADAWWLRHIGLYAYGLSTLPRTAFRDHAVAQITWPTITEIGATR